MLHPALWCGECGQEVAAYKGETGRNAYTRGVEHLTALQSKNKDKLILWLHSIYHHNRRVTRSNKCPLDRHCQEQVDISYFGGPVLMNRKTELGV